MLAEAGHTITDDEKTADIIVINTCCFIGDAKEESIQTILEMASYKEGGSLKGLIVTGCLAQRYRDEIETELPEVDAVLGVHSYDSIVCAIQQVAEGKRYRKFDEPKELPPKGTKRLVTTGGHYAFLKIAEGCEKHCTYCAIPQIRGKYQSAPLEKLVCEAKELAAGGVKELILVAQETTCYGVDLYGKKSLDRLLDELNQIPGLAWIRILYCYPEEIDDALIDAILRNEKVCHYLDLPIQHSVDDVLKRMGRKTGRDDIIRIVNRLRERIPDICLRTTLISGFPGETQEDFEDLYRFVNEMEFDRLGVFPYSQEEDTAAALMPDQIPDEVKEFRRDELMELQQAIAFEKAQEMAGQVLTVMIEGKVADDDVYVGRTYRDAPGVDGYLFVNTSADLMTGDFVRAIVTDSNEYDLIGEIYYEEDELT